MGYLIDTNVLSELRKKHRCNKNVRDWMDKTDENSVYISVLTLGEVRQGIGRIQHRDPASAKALENWLLDVKRKSQGRILPVTQEIANRWGVINSGNPLPVCYRCFVSGNGS